MIKVAVIVIIIIALEHDNQSGARTDGEGEGQRVSATCGSAASSCKPQIPPTDRPFSGRGGRSLHSDQINCDMCAVAAAAAHGMYGQTIDINKI